MQCTAAGAWEAEYVVVYLCAVRVVQEYDFPTCDLLLVMGTSLVVHPFASLIGEQDS
jgi:hypothetical protein